MATNLKNLLQGRRAAVDAEQPGPARGDGAAVDAALAQDGGLPVKGLLFQVDATTQQQLVNEFFLT